MNILQEEPDKVDKLLHAALMQFTQILAKGGESNLFAAHGAAAVLAEQATRANPPKIDYLIPAKRILDKVSFGAVIFNPRHSVCCVKVDIKTVSDTAFDCLSLQHQLRCMASIKSDSRGSKA